MTDNSTISNLRVDIRGDLEERKPGGGWETVMRKKRVRIETEVDNESELNIATLVATFTITLFILKLIS